MMSLLGGHLRLVFLEPPGWLQGHPIYNAWIHSELGLHSIMKPISAVFPCGSASFHWSSGRRNHVTNPHLSVSFVAREECVAGWGEGQPEVRQWPGSGGGSSPVEPCLLVGSSDSWTHSVLCLTSVLCEGTAQQVCLSTSVQCDPHVLLLLHVSNTSRSCVGRVTSFWMMLL